MSLFSITAAAAGPPEPSWNIKTTHTITVVLESAKGESESVRDFEPAR